ncbi:MAG TPA: acyltransferase family protein, partial [Puia sp.]
MPQPKQLYLEFVRGTVAILVFIAHTIELLPPISNAPDRFMINYVGTDSVMIFFLLSGCVINISQTRKPKSQKEFFVNRIIRLYPQFFTGVLLALIVIFVLKMPTPSLGNIFGNFFMFSTIQGYITTCFRTNLPVWTLTFEMFFYIMFLVCIGSNTKRKIWIWFFLSLLMMPLYYLKLG